MEVLYSPILGKDQLLSTISPFKPTFSFPNRFRAIPLRTHKSHPNFRSKIPFCISSSFHTGQNLKISSHFGQRSKRRNSLRKKLSEEQKVRQKPDLDSNFHNLIHVPDKIEEFGSNLNDNNFKQSSSSSVENSRAFGESVLWSKLENWVDQYKTETEVWGIGSAPIFTVLQDVEGNVERVSVNEDEILRRSGIEPLSFREKELGVDLMKVNLKISHAKSLAKEIETGEYKIPKNSTIAKVVVQGKQSGFINGLRSVTIQPDKFSRIGVAMLCGWFMYWTIKRIFISGNDVVELKREEKEMLRRKMKSRVEREKMERGTVEVIPHVSEPLMEPTERPRLDKQELMNNILKAKASGDKLTSLESAESRDFDDKVKEIKEMARKARELEKLPNDMEDSKMHKEMGLRFLNNPSDGYSRESMDINGTIKPASLYGSLTVDTEFILEASPGDATKDSDSGTSTLSVSMEDPKDALNNIFPTMSVSSSSLHLEEMDEERNFRSLVAGSDVIQPSSDEEFNDKARQRVHEEPKVLEYSMFEETSDTKPMISACEDSSLKKTGSDSDFLQSISNKIGHDEVMDIKNEVDDLRIPNISRDYTDIDQSAEDAPAIAKQSWIEKNFQEFDPIVKKIGVGFRENYMVAKEKVQEELNLNPEITQLGSDEDDSELEWMKNDGLREIVFQVRENELMGRDPFYMMDAEDKRAFFEGLERKVEKQNTELLNLHEYIHSRVENLDYGADGISLYDQPDKIIPRWKGPPVEKNPEHLDNFVQEHKEFFVESMGISPPVNKDSHDTLQKSVKSPAVDNMSSVVHNIKKSSQERTSINSKTVIDCSDGSSRAAKKSGKEYWQHTKKWSREFLEAYNAETDPEVKSIMKDMGKDLDRWITDKEIKETAELMTRIPKKRRRYIEKKLGKLKREMELFGPQAVVSKYREYAEEKEEDYLWWLDLPHVLCIELYTNEDGGQRVGFYSLEMAADLELDPKQYHVIAFEDPGDSKNFCYIIQAHMEMLGNGNAFVVARPPKDAFREAKANGFSVTVIRKGELPLNVDQTLEEVEEQITEIGSKIYHDKIMRERSVNIGSLMKGVFGSGKPTQRRRSKRVLKKPTKS
ncbi:hypothetical protein BVC80_1819g16 [Macleaya cordata]|uniref:Embryo defective 1703 n=1 Tax=Macleaya cordata TaxID=56857 RepID=A0A200QW64_MACCD|nr:hypothetical protein BVC80_1819g16 [Macleaya cordata]